MATSLKSRPPGGVLYLYGITAEGQGAIAGVAGVDGSAPIDALPCSGLVCWTSSVDHAQFDENLPSNMENLEWLAQVSVRHQQAVAAIARSHDILPARFGTVFRGAASLAADVRKRKPQLIRDLKRIAGCEEWGVKVFRLQQQAPAATRAKSGRDYLRAKAAVLRTQPSAQADPEVQEFLRALQTLAVETAAGPGAVSRGQRGLLWQGSLLLERSRRPRLQQLLARYSRQWHGQRSIEASGPWPPYSFVSHSKGRQTEAGRS